MALSDIEVYDREIAGNAIELLGQKINKFNAASGNTLTLSSAAWAGNYDTMSFYNQISSAKRRVDRNAANATQASTALTQGSHTAVKVAGGFGPILFEPSQLSYMKRNPGEAVMVIAEGFADALLADQLNSALASAVAAVENVAALVNDVSASGPITQVAINNSHRKFGDSSGSLAADFMTGDVYHRLIGEALANTSQLFVSGNVQVVSILGKLAVVTDSPALFEAGTPDKDKVLSVVNQGIIVDNSTDIITNLETTNGKQRIETTWQADYTFGLRLKGYAWDTTNGGESPLDAELATGTNWDQSAAENKQTLGTLAIGDAA